PGRGRRRSGAGGPGGRDGRRRAWPATASRVQRRLGPATAARLPPAAGPRRRRRLGGPLRLRGAGGRFSRRRIGPRHAYPEGRMIALLLAQIRTRWGQALSLLVLSMVATGAAVSAPVFADSIDRAAAAEQ